MAVGGVAPDRTGAALPASASQAGGADAGRRSPAIRPTRRRRRVGRALSALGGIVTTLFGLLLLTFFIGRMLPIDPVMSIVGEDADRQTYEMVYRQLGLDQPLHVQFLLYMRDMLTGDLGNAVLTGRPVLDDILRVFPATLELATASIVIGAGLGVPLGVLAAVYRGRVFDHIVRIFSLIGYSTPIFWLGMMGLLLFYAQLGWVGGSGRVDLFHVGLVPDVTGMILIDSALSGEWDVFRSALRHIVLPASVLGYASVAYISRMTRSFMLEQLNQEYIVTARVKGLSQRDVIWRHAFRNIRVPLITIVALAYGGLVEGAVLIEAVFAWPGFGQYLTNALTTGDMNAVMGCVLVVGLIFILLNLLTDVLYRVFDPRTR